MSRAQEWILTARQALALIQQHGEAEVELLTRDDLVSLGQRLWWLSKHVSNLIEKVKDRLRKEAARKPSKDQQRFEAGDQSGHCLVIPSPSTVEVKPDADMRPIRQALGAAFSEYFDEDTIYRPRKGFQDRFINATPEEQARLLEVVTVNPRASRVIFKD